MNNNKILTYKELIKYDNIIDRYNYLKLDGDVGRVTFGYDRYLNQLLYDSDEWKSLRDKIILRDNGNDLGIEGFEIGGKVIIHHMNPIEKSDILQHNDFCFDPNYLITVSLQMHNAIHYGSKLPYGYILTERTPNDTCPWRR